MRRFAILPILLCLALLPSASAWANSGPPPAQLWFAFEDESGRPLTPQGVQLVGCDPDCSNEILLQTYGACDQPGCLSGEPALNIWSDKLSCSSAQPGWEALPSPANQDSTIGLCQATSYDYPGQFRLVAQIDGQVYTSEPRPFTEQQYSDWEQAFRVIVSPSGLALVEHPDFEAPGGYWPGFIPSLLLTLVVELLVAGLYLGLLLKLRGPALVNLLVLVGLADLVTFPLVWFFFPSFAPFTPSYNLALGYFLLFAGLLFTILLAIFFLRTEGRKRWIFVSVATLLALLVIPICSIMVLFATSYGGGYNLSGEGLPGSGLLLASEIFAVLFEAGFIYFLSRKALALKHALLLSLLMNLASYLVGLTLIQIIN
jgi:hypothetical protein